MPLRISVSWKDPAPAPALSPTEIATTTSEGILYDVVQQRLYEQMARHDSLDGKALTSFSFGSTVLPITFGLLSVADQEEPRRSLFQPLLYSAVAIYVVILVLSALAFLRRRMSLRPDLATMHNLSEEHPPTIVHRWTAREFVLSINENEETLKRKARFVGWAIVLSVVEAMLLTAAAAVTLL